MITQVVNKIKRRLALLLQGLPFVEAFILLALWREAKSSLLCSFSLSRSRRDENADGNGKWNGNGNGNGKTKKGGKTVAVAFLPDPSLMLQSLAEFFKRLYQDPLALVIVVVGLGAVAAWLLKGKEGG